MLIIANNIKIIMQRHQNNPQMQTSCLLRLPLMLCNAVNGFTSPLCNASQKPCYIKMEIFL